VLRGLLPAWVEADPLRSRATDALGLQAVADRLADRLLPGLSVLTTRARYFTFFCWAREEIGREYDERRIHRYEVALTLAEASISDSDSDHAESCQFVGSRNVRNFPRDKVPSDPRLVYKAPAWRAYRASMVGLGLLEDSVGFPLTNKGVAAAKYFRAAVRHRTAAARPLPTRACLSEVSNAECRHLRDLLGLSIRGRLDLEEPDGRTRRALFAREVREVFRRHGLSPETVLPRYEDRRALALPEPMGTLREAAVWERLSIGLNVVFTAWVRAIEAGTTRLFERHLISVLRRRHAQPTLERVPFGGDDDRAALSLGVASLEYALRLHDSLCDRGGVLPEESAFDLARGLLHGDRTSRTRVRETLERLRQRHRLAKGDEAWLREGTRGELEIARNPGEAWTLPAVVRPHAYRLAAFDQIAYDLGGL
jgi:hypothetical protein